jgi:NitT/TauT family transport system substrate-binding protein
VSTTRRQFSAGIVSLLASPAVVTSARAQGAKKVKLLLDWAFLGQQAVFTVPADDGTFAKLGFDVTVDRGVGSGDTVAKVAAGAYDIGLADTYSMIRFNGANPNHQLISVMMVHDKSALAVETKADSAIKEPKDLNGKRIAAPVGDASRQLFPLFADSNKVDQSSIKWINVSPELRETMLLRDEADAITGHITTVLPNMLAMKVQPEKIRIMAFADYGVDLFGHSLVVRADAADKHSDLIKAMARGIVHGMNVSRKDPATAIKSLQKHYPLLNVEIETLRLKMSMDYFYITPNVLQNGLSNVDMARLDRTIKSVAKPFELKTIPPASQVYTDKYLPPRADLKLAS